MILAFPSFDLAELLEEREKYFKSLVILKFSLLLSKHQSRILLDKKKIMNLSHIPNISLLVWEAHYTKICLSIMSNKLF